MLNNVSFRAGALDSAKDILNQPQKYAKQPNAQGAPTGPEADAFVKPKKKHTVRNAIIGSLVAAAAVVTGLVVGHKMGGFNKLIEKAGAEGAGGFAKFAGKAAEYGEKAGEWLTKQGSNAWKTVTGMFKKGAEGAGEAAGEAVA